MNLRVSKMVDKIPKNKVGGAFCLKQHALRGMFRSNYLLSPNPQPFDFVRIGGRSHRLRDTVAVGFIDDLDADYAALIALFPGKHPSIIVDRTPILQEPLVEDGSNFRASAEVGWPACPAPRTSRRSTLTLNAP